MVFREETDSFLAKNARNSLFLLGEAKLRLRVLDSMINTLRSLIIDGFFGRNRFVPRKERSKLTVFARRSKAPPALFSLRRRVKIES